MDGCFPWKTLFFNGWFGGKTHYFWKHPYVLEILRRLVNEKTYPSLKLAKKNHLSVLTSWMMHSWVSRRYHQITQFFGDSPTFSSVPHSVKRTMSTWKLSVQRFVSSFGRAWHKLAGAFGLSLNYKDDHVYKILPGIKHVPNGTEWDAFQWLGPIGMQSSEVIPFDWPACLSLSASLINSHQTRLQCCSAPSLF